MIINFYRLRMKTYLFIDFYQVIDKLPESRWNNIRYLIKFFHELSRRHEHNKMTSQNLAIVLAPSLLWSPVFDLILGLITY
jgi:hypothetical protein